MDTIEVLIYTIIAILVGSLLIKVVINYENKKPEITNFKVTKNGFFPKTLQCWEECGFGVKNMTFNVYVSVTGILGKDELMEYLILTNKESILREQDLYMDNIIIPTIVQLRCEGYKLNISS